MFKGIFDPIGPPCITASQEVDGGGKRSEKDCRCRQCESGSSQRGFMFRKGNKRFACWGYTRDILSCADLFFSKLTVSKSFYRIIIRVVNSLDPVKQATTERTCLKGPLKGNSHAHHSYVEKQEKLSGPCLSDHLRLRINIVFRYSYVSGYFHIFLTEESN